MPCCASNVIWSVLNKLSLKSVARDTLIWNLSISVKGNVRSHLSGTCLWQSDDHLNHSITPLSKVSVGNVAWRRLELKEEERELDNIRRKWSIFLWDISPHHPHLICKCNSRNLSFSTLFQIHLNSLSSLFFFIQHSFIPPFLSSPYLMCWGLISFFILSEFPPHFLPAWET